MKYRSWSSVCRFTTHSRLMYPSALFNLFPSRKHLLAIGVALVSALGPVAAQQARKKLAAFDTKKYHFGFAISGNRSDFNLALTLTTASAIACSPSSINPKLDSTWAWWLWDATKNLHVRFIPGLSFQDRSLEYRFEEDDGTDLKVRRTESVYLNFPLLLKLRTTGSATTPHMRLLVRNSARTCNRRRDQPATCKRLHFAIGVR